MNIMSSHRTDEWLTPLPILDLVREVLGDLDLDPASSEQANERVGARDYFTCDSDGLSSVWPDAGTVYLSPPGGKVNNQSRTALFWKKLMEHQSTRAFKHGIFMAFSAEARQTTQGHGVLSINDFPNCTPARRIKFDHADGHQGESPAHSNCIVYVPGSVDKTDKFIRVFRTIGATR